MNDAQCSIQPREKVCAFILLFTHSLNNFVVAILLRPHYTVHIPSWFAKIPARPLCDDFGIFAGCLHHLLVHQTLDSAFGKHSTVFTFHSISFYIFQLLANFAIAVLKGGIHRPSKRHSSAMPHWDNPINFWPRWSSQTHWCRSPHLRVNVHRHNRRKSQWNQCQKQQQMKKIHNNQRTNENKF